MMEVKDWITATLGVIGTATGIYNLTHTWRKERAAAQRAIDQLWTLEIDAGPGTVVAQIAYGPGGPPVRLISLHVIKPLAARLQRSVLIERFGTTLMKDRHGQPEHLIFFDEEIEHDARREGRDDRRLRHHAASTDGVG